MALADLLVGAGASLTALELISYSAVKLARGRFQWMITSAKDRFPRIDKAGIEAKYLGKNGGFDPELGWVRKPNTSGKDRTFCKLEDGKWGYRETTWKINERGSRENPGNEHLDDRVISCYGDSFTFARQVNDEETWEHKLSKMTGTNVLNWGVGNYGLDQAILRIEREFPQNPTKIVIMGVVADTISRTQSMWKHFYEYGNIWAFKPRFELDETGKLKLIKNIIDDPEKFLEIPQYVQELRKHDYFAKQRFDNDLMRFPFSLSLLRNPARNLRLIYGALLSQGIEELFSQKARAADPLDWKVARHIRRENLEWTARLYENEGATRLMHALVDKFIEQGERLGFHPVFALLPQKNEALYARDEGSIHMPFLKDISGRVETIDLTIPISNHPNIDSLYSENTDYGAHYSSEGNALVGKVIYDRLKRKSLI